MKCKNNKGSAQDKKPSRKISRKEAIKKVGYGAFSAATMMVLLNNPAKANSASLEPNTPPEWEEGDWI